MHLINIIILFVVCVASPLAAAEVPHPYVQVTTEQTTTSGTLVDVPGAALTDGDFDDGEIYWVEVVASLAETANGGLVCVDVVHGSTTFEGSTHCGARSSTTNEYYGWSFGTRWTAVAGEGLKLRFRSSDGTSTVSAHFVVVRALRLSGYLADGVDYCFGERTTDDTLGTTATDGASCALTMVAASDLLVKTHALIAATTTGDAMESRIVRSGESSTTTPGASFPPDNALTIYGIPLARVYAVGTGANTFKEQSQAGAAATHERRYSNVFVLNLNKFTAHASAYTATSTTLSTTDYATQLGSIAISPTVAGDVWIGASLIADRLASSGDVEARVQIDNADALSGMTAASLNYDQFNVTNLTTNTPVMLGMVASVSAGSRSIDFDVSSDIASGVDAMQWTVFAFTLDMPSTGQFVLPPLVMQ